MRVNRLNDMEELIMKEGTITWEDLASYFHVSTNTIRRDVNELVKRGSISKVYGGVAATGGYTPLSVRDRSLKESDKKQTIGELAAAMVEDHETVFLDSGTTVPCLIPHLAKKEDITIVTHSLEVMYEAAKYPSLKVLALGGYYNTLTASYAGISTLNILDRIKTDFVFIAATGVSLENGLTHTAYFEAETKRKVVTESDRVVLVADTSKFDQAAMITFMDFDKLYAIVTDSRPPERYVEAAKREGIRLIYAGCEE
jgi:DeoR family transcriptional regulator, myo-inositol catabolism operon repressor